MKCKTQSYKFLNIKYTATDKVTDNMKPTNWKKCNGKRKHFKNINFLTLSRKPIVNILIGMGYPEFKGVKEDLGEAITNLTSLGWTCIGNTKNSHECTQYERSYSTNKKRTLSKSRQAI